MKGGQYGARTGGRKKCGSSILLGYPQAPQDCIDKALDSLEYRNTGWNPTVKEGKVTKIRKKIEDK